MTGGAVCQSTGSVQCGTEEPAMRCFPFLSFEFLPKRAIGLVHDVLRCVLVRHEPEREVVKPVTVLVVQPFEYRFIQNHLFLSFDMALYHTNIAFFKDYLIKVLIVF